MPETILIDGHNLIGRMPGLALSDPEDEAKLVALLKRYRARHKRDIVVVFDGAPTEVSPNVVRRKQWVRYNRSLARVMPT